MRGHGGGTEVCRFSSTFAWIVNTDSKRWSTASRRHSARNARAKNWPLNSPPSPSQARAAEQARQEAHPAARAAIPVAREPAAVATSTNFPQISLRALRLFSAISAFLRFSLSAWIYRVVNTFPSTRIHPPSQREIGHRYVHSPTFDVQIRTCATSKFAGSWEIIFIKRLVTATIPNADRNNLCQENP